MGVVGPHYNWPKNTWITVGIFHPYTLYMELITINLLITGSWGPPCVLREAFGPYLSFCPPQKTHQFEVEKINWDWKKIVPPSLGWRNPVNSQGISYFSPGGCVFFFCRILTHTKTGVFFQYLLKLLSCFFFQLKKLPKFFLNQPGYSLQGKLTYPPDKTGTFEDDEFPNFTLWWDMWSLLGGGYIIGFLMGGRWWFP